MNNYDRNTIIARKGGCGSGKSSMKVPTNFTPIELSYELEVPTNFIKGLDGKSAYQSALDAGYVGTEEDFYKNLKKAGEDHVIDEGDIDVNKLGIVADQISIGKDITVTSPIGSYRAGDVISASHSLYDVLLMMMKSNYFIPSYVMPVFNSITVTSNKNLNSIELGDIVTLNITANYTQNDAGASTGVKYYINNYLLGETPTPNLVFTKDHQFTELNNVLKVVISYTDGPIRTDSEGKAYEKGRIKAGEIESTLNITAFNSVNTLFIGTSFSQVTRESLTNDFITSLENKFDDPKPGRPGYIAEIPNGSKSIIIAYPTRLGMLHEVMNLRTSINEIDAFENNMFVKTIYTDVQSTPTSYYVYYSTSSIGLNKLTYKILI